MKFQRSGGILLHPTSLPGSYGIGDLGPQARRFIDWLALAGCKLWQVLPLGPTGYGDSPYQSFSAFAGNPYLISPQVLAGEGLLAHKDLLNTPVFSESRVDYGEVIPWKVSLLEKAYARFEAFPDRLGQAFDEFQEQHGFWLDDYSLFMAVKESQNGRPWNEWPEPLKSRDHDSLRRVRNELAGQCRKHAFIQFVFFRQWLDVREYAHQHGIQIIGDIPIFTAYDSADVWARPALFQLDRRGKPVVVAGVPPDLFSSTGQLWGNPLYDLENHRQDGYSWWLSRIRSALKSVDIVRIDHFRGFAGYYEIPADHETAELGRWVKGPGAEFFRAVDQHLGDGLQTRQTGLPIIAEDLGVITPDVIELLSQFDLPGMKVLQFGFSSPENPFLPHHYVTNCVAYTGTHDNDTALGWLSSADCAEREFALRYLGVDGEHFAWDMIREVWRSVAVFAIAPMQDVLGLGGEGRMNYPSRLGGNWKWRMHEGVLREHDAERLRDLNTLYSR